MIPVEPEKPIYKFVWSSPVSIHIDRGLPNDAILHLLELTLRRNDFQFAGRIFLQLCGTAMGKDYAPSLANIFLQTFDRHAMEDYGEFSRLYSR